MPRDDNHPILPFESEKKFKMWLAKNHKSSDGIWLRFYKVNSGIKTISYAEALDCALCYGWIDGKLKSHCKDSYLRKFTPRRPRSIWSKINTNHAERLISEKKMKASGLKEIEAAKNDGRWKQAYSSPKNSNVPKALLDKIKKHKKANATFKSLSKANIYAICWRIETAKRQETKNKRMKDIFEMLKKGETKYY